MCSRNRDVCRTAASAAAHATASRLSVWPSTATSTGCPSEGQFEGEVCTALPALRLVPTERGSVQPAVGRLVCFRGYAVRGRR